MRYVAFDTETTLIAPRAAVHRPEGSKEFVPAAMDTRVPRAIYTEPFPIPDLVCGSMAEEGGSGTYSADAICDKVEAALDDPNTVTIWHNLAFDFQVLSKYRPSLHAKFLRAAREERIHDTMYLDLLVGLSMGRYDVRKPPLFGREEVKTRSLEVLAKHYLNMELDKDPTIRLGYGQFRGQWPLPDKFIEYARLDAVATYDIGRLLLSEAGPKALSSAYQVQMALVVSDMEQRGVHIDTDEAKRLREIFQRDLPGLRNKLVECGLGLWKNKANTIREVRVPIAEVKDMCTTWRLDSDGMIHRTKLFKNHAVLQTAEPNFGVKQNEVRAALQSLVPELPEVPPMTETGLLSLDHEFWKQYIPPTDEGLLAWAQYEKLQKIIGTYLTLYSVTPRVFPRWTVLGARSGRMSASSPSIQNVPKRRHGIRSLFVAEPGKVFIVADYTAQEVYTLCEAMHHLGIEGPLAEVLKSGGDIHTTNAARLLNKPPDEVTKDERQLAKVLVFGIGGGLGPKKLADSATRDYGIPMTIDEAREAKKKFLEVFWDVKRYLDHVQKDLNQSLMITTGRGIEFWRTELGVTSRSLLDLKKAFLRSPHKGVLFTAEQQLKVTLPTGRVRAKCTYTEGANTYFQGLASDVTKRAAFLCMDAGLECTLIVHDEIVITSTEEDAALESALLKSAMLAAFVEVCPFIGAYAKVEVSPPSRRWNKATDAHGKVL